MHEPVRQWVRSVKEMYPEKFRNAEVCEVGSLNINGSVRDLFEKCSYLGVDLGEGHGVDLVAPDGFQSLDFREGYFDVVHSEEAFEHAEKWRELLYAMVYTLKLGGLLMVTCATPARGEHGTKKCSPQDSPYTNDWYRGIQEEELRNEISKYKWLDHKIDVGNGGMDLYFYGIKG